jgi:hypothetical protein
MKNPAHWPGFFVFGFFGSDGAVGGGLCRATFFNISSNCAGTSSRPSLRAASMNLALWLRDCFGEEAPGRRVGRFADGDGRSVIAFHLLIEVK